MKYYLWHLATTDENVEATTEIILDNRRFYYRSWWGCLHVSRLLSRNIFRCFDTKVFSAKFFSEIIEFRPKGPSREYRTRAVEPHRRESRFALKDPLTNYEYMIMTSKLKPNRLNWNGQKSQDRKKLAKFDRKFCSLYFSITTAWFIVISCQKSYGKLEVLLWNFGPFAWSNTKKRPAFVRNFLAKNYHDSTLSIHRTCHPVMFFCFLNR